jgi:hypothetical protein
MSSKISIGDLARGEEKGFLRKALGNGHPSSKKEEGMHGK